MEYLRGCTLEDLLERQGPFSGREAALVGQDLCRALAAVHGAGLVHRDIKAQNVIREEGGRVVLMDFGTGLLLENEESVRSAPIAGTPLYLAPEVLNGRDASPASDVYSVGVLLFHLVTGTYPYAVRSLAELRQAQRKSARQRLQDLRPDLSEGFVQAVDRAMDIDPAARYQSAGALQQGLSAALGFESAPLTASAPNVPPPAPEEPAASVAATAARRLTTRVVVGAVAALLVFVLAGVGLSRYWAPPLAPVDSVVVLPFVHLGSENADLAQGIQLVIADRLSSLSSLRVVRYTSQMQARDRGLALSDVIARHEVAAAIDGDVSWTGSSAKVSVRLMRAGSSSPVWVRRRAAPSSCRGTWLARLPARCRCAWHPPRRPASPKPIRPSRVCSSRTCAAGRRCACGPDRPTPRPSRPSSTP
jgi:TolB-like protein